MAHILIVEDERPINELICRSRSPFRLRRSPPPP